MTTKRAVGIDLGSTNSLAACVTENRHTEIVPDEVGNLLLPSIVLFEDNKVVVGEEAKLKGAGHPHRLVSRVKRYMGKESQLPPVDGLSLPPEVVSACILSALRKNATKQLGREFAVVIAVPTFFTEPQRKATADAGEMAGLDVLDLVNEPVAAVLAASEHTDLLSPAADSAGSRIVLVFDLGGFTFEATLLEIYGGGLKPLGSCYDENLGGHNWDKRLADYLAQQFVQRYHIDPSADPPGREHLQSKALRARHTLSLRHWAPVVVSYAGKVLETKITRETFAGLTATLVQQAAELTRNMIEAVGLRWNRISRVILVGGGTRMPMVRQMLRELTEQEPDYSVHPDEAVARGAAIYAAHLLAMAGSSGEPQRFRVTNVSSHSVGIEGIDQKTGRKINRVLIPRGTPLPAKATEKFVTKASSQRIISIRLLEGESKDPDECTTIGRAIIRNLPSELTEEWPVDVTCEYTSGGRIKVDSQVRYTDRKVHLELVRTLGLSSEHIRRWKEVVTSDAGYEAFRAVHQAESHPPVAMATSEDAGQHEKLATFLKQKVRGWFVSSHGSEAKDTDQASSPESEP